VASINAFNSSGLISHASPVIIETSQGRLMAGAKKAIAPETTPTLTLVSHRIRQVHPGKKMLRWTISLP